jgi:hypothetical protein
MKNYRSRVMLAVLPNCATGPCAVNAKEKVIAWLSTVSTFWCNSVINGASDAPGQLKTIGTSAEKKKAAPKSGRFPASCSILIWLNLAQRL